MCKEMTVIPVNKVVDPKRIIEKMEVRGGGEVQGVADPQKVCLSSQNTGIETKQSLQTYVVFSS
jgi:hypothetical protein